jgi:hypothetical protein
MGKNVLGRQFEKRFIVFSIFSCGCKQYKSLHIDSVTNVGKCFEINNTNYRINLPELQASAGKRNHAMEFMLKTM